MNEYKYADIEVGKTECFCAEITEDTISRFRELTGDDNPLHKDDDYAKEKGYWGKVGFGMLTAAFLSTLAGVYLPGKYSLIQQIKLDFSNPVFAGDKLEITGEVTEKNDLFNLIYIKVTIRNQNEKKVLRGNMQVRVTE